MKTKVDMKAKRAANQTQLAADVAKFDAMCRTVEQGGQRHLKAPPMRLLPPVVTAAQLELRQARKMGHAA